MSSLEQAMLHALLVVLLASANTAAGTSLPESEAQSPSVAVAPQANLTGLIKPDDYPAEALENHEQGTVAVRIAVDERGAVTGCKVETSSGSPSLDAKTCTIVLERARFSPARDATGRAVAGEFHQRISWKLEDPIEAPPSAASPELARLAAELPKAAKPAELLNPGEVARSDDYPRDAIGQQLEGLVRARLLIDGDGRVARCWIVGSSGHTMLDAQTCDLYTANARFRPARDWRGRPVPSLFDQRMDWKLTGGADTPPNWITRLTVVVGPKGEARSCRLVALLNGSWEEAPPNADACPEVLKGPPEFRLATREMSKLHDAVVVTETHILTEVRQPMPILGRSRGQVLVALRSARMKFAPDGKRTSCTKLESIGLEGHNDVCLTPSDQLFSPPRTLLGKFGLDVRFMTAIFLTGEPE